MYDHLPPPFDKHDLDSRLVPLRKEMWAHDLADLRMEYAVLDAWNAGATVRDIAKAGRVTEVRVTKLIAYSEQHGPPRVPGRLGRSPLEVLYMYGVGEISWEQCLQDLGTWPYEPMPDLTDSWDDVAPHVPGSWQDVASMTGILISIEEYGALFEARQAWMRGDRGDT